MTWLRLNFHEDDASHVRQTIADSDFWHYVDTQAAPYALRCTCSARDIGEDPRCQCWDHQRGSSCLAGNAQRERCRMRPVLNVPFCEFHLERAWEALYSLAHGTLLDHHLRERESFWGKASTRADVDAAQVEDARRALESRPERVYFYAVDGFVKIGRSVHPEQRVKSFGAVLAPEGIDIRAGRLLGTIPGGSSVELALHQRFRPHRAVGEWFHLHQSVSEAIADLLSEALATPA